MRNLISVRILSKLLSFRRIINTLIITIFFLHGLLYFFNPQDIYNPSSPIKLIKYILIGALLIFNLDKILLSDFILFLIISLFSITFLYGSNQDTQNNYTILLSKFLVYVAPVIMLLVYRTFRDVPWVKIMWITLIIASFAGYAEFYLLSGLFRQFSYSDNSLRIASIFISPNNAGLIFALLNYFVIEDLKINRIKQFFFGAFIISNSLVLILLTGSKTGLVIIFLHLSIRLGRYLIRILYKRSINKRALKFLILCVLPLMFFPLMFLFYSPKSANDSAASTRELNLATGSIRIEQIQDFFRDVSTNFVTPFYNKGNFTLDNAYLQYWGDFSLLGFLALVFLIFFVSFKLIQLRSKIQFPFFVLIITGFSLNIFYIWPGSYLFWTYVILIIKSKELNYYTFPARSERVELPKI